MNCEVEYRRVKFGTSHAVQLQASYSDRLQDITSFIQKEVIDDSAWLFKNVTLAWR